MPRLTLDDLSSKVSATVRKLNPGLFGSAPGLGGLDAGKRGKPQGALERTPQAQRRSKARVAKGHELVVTIVAHVRRRLDSDNLANACKPLRDEIADWLGVDDGDERVRWQYGQVETRGRTGASVRIERR